MLLNPEVKTHYPRQTSHQSLRTTQLPSDTWCLPIAGEGEHPFQLLVTWLLSCSAAYSGQHSDHLLAGSARMNKGRDRVKRRPCRQGDLWSRGPISCWAAPCASHWATSSVHPKCLLGDGCFSKFGHLFSALVGIETPFPINLQKAHIQKYSANK